MPGARRLSYSLTVTPSPAPDTRVYAERRTTQGKTNKDIIRCLKRYIAREVYAAIQADLNPTTTS